MTEDEVCHKYNIPLKIIDEYCRWDCDCCTGCAHSDGQYTEADLERLSTIVTLYDVGFSKEEIERYMNLLIQGESTGAERLKMLSKKRSDSLDEIHCKEKQLSCLDYLRHKIKSQLEQK